MRSNNSIEWTTSGALRAPSAAAHVKRWHHPILTMRIALALLLSSAVGACGGGDSSSVGTDVPFTTVAQTQYSGVTASEGVVVRSQSEFTAVWARYSARSVPPPPPPAIDFSAVQVLGFFLGTRTNGCYTVSITRVTQSASSLVVAYKEQVAGTLCTQSLVDPAHLVAVPMSQLQVEFVPE
jgi:hypothetical protein